MEEKLFVCGNLSPRDMADNTHMAVLIADTPKDVKELIVRLKNGDVTEKEFIKEMAKLIVEKYGRH